MSNRTPLYEAHLAANAKMVDFHGWEMPIDYGSQIEEHNAVRQKAGMFDVSHMTVVDITGKDARSFLFYLVANDIGKLKEPGRALYTCMLNEQGGVIDDLIIYYLNDEYYRLVVNCATRERDLNWMQQQSEKFDVAITPRPQFAMIAIQGPEARELAAKAMPLEQADASKDLKRFACSHLNDWFITRTGYTGEDGFEVVLPPEEAVNFWNKLIDVGVKPCGLGARDTLRLEAGLNLSGTDMDETVTPFESNLNWTVKLEPEDRQFIGREVLEKQKQEGVTKTLKGIVLKDKGVLRHGQKVLQNGEEIGVITSGSFSPILQRGIALARISLNAEDDCEVESRGRSLAAQIISLPFITSKKTK